MSQEKMTFDTKPSHVDVSIDGKDYVLKEASASDAKEFRNAALKSFRFGEDGGPESIVGDGVADADILLVSLCLYEKVENSEGETNLIKVKKALVNSWPARVVKGLFEKAKDISDLGEDSDKDSLTKQRDKLSKQIEKLQDKEDLRKNSQETERDGSG